MDIDHAKRTLQFVGDLIKDRYKHQIYSIPNVNLIPTTKGILAAPSESVITDGASAPAGFWAVADEIVRDPIIRALLIEKLEVKELSNESWDEFLEASLNAAEQLNAQIVWENFLYNLSTAPDGALSSFFGHVDFNRIRFRALSGDWNKRNIMVVTESGANVPHDNIVDLSYISQLSIKLPQDALSEFPTGNETISLRDEAVSEYLRAARNAFRDLCILGRKSRPQESLVNPSNEIRFPASWRLLQLLPAAYAARLTTSILQNATTFQVKLQPITMVHSSRREAYPKVTAPHPFWSWMTKHGRVQVGKWIYPIRAIQPDLATILADIHFPRFEDVASFFESRNQESDLGPNLKWDQVKLTASASENFWKSLFEGLEDRDSEFSALRGIWEFAHIQGFIPTRLPTSEGVVPLESIYVTTDPSVGHDLDDGRIVLLDEATASDWVKAGAQELTADSTLSFDKRLSSPSHLLDLFPELAISIELANRVDHLSAVWVEGLKELIGPLQITTAVAMDPDGAILLDHASFSNSGRSEGISLLLRCLARHGLAPRNEEFDLLLEKILDRRGEEARARVRGQSTLAGRLLEAVGRNLPSLLSILTPATRQAIGDSATPDEVAELALAVHGPAVLSRLRDELEAQGLAPPKRWGGEPARSFVLDLGFPLEFASSVGGRRDAEFSVSGPVGLPPLHDYQEEILDDVERLLSSGSGRRRAVVSLPTGGGKTRVAAEAVVRLVLRSEGRRSALWIAQTDELCEQAVQCFRQLWVNVGEPGEDLRVVRLWGGQRSPAPSEGDEAVVVVASIQTLNSRSDRAELDWISQAGIIVIDECHHAIAASYTDLLRWLDVQVGSERMREREAPIIGLSATPWRGYNEDESERLAGRFDRRWFPADQAGLHNKLSTMGVLAERSYRPLHYNRPITLTEREQQHVDTFGELPDSVVDRIGEDQERNDLIVKAVLDSPAKSILLFANSVSHAQYLAARLHIKGCSAAAVSGQTDRLARQYFTKKFRSGELRVICNHSVLTTGFDAPKADMILISRPVFSPVLYMQMVGRGLRGPANGGTARCEIMTVEDNILNFRDRLAYHFCRRFFD